jgi:hypothetical protein
MNKKYLVTGSWDASVKVGFQVWIILSWNKKNFFFFHDLYSPKLQGNRRQDYHINAKGPGGNSQNFLCKFVRFFVTLGLKILRLLRLQVVF